MRDVYHKRPRRVEHGIVDRSVAIPDRLIAPNGRWLQRRRLARRAVVVRGLHLSERGVHRVEHRQIIAALLGRSINQAIRVHLGIALVGGDFVVQVSLGIGPIPLRDDDVALDALRARRRVRGQFAVLDARGPIAELFRGSLGAEVRQAVHHERGGLPGLHAARPSLGGRHVAEHVRDRARIFIAKLVAGFAAIRFDQMEPFALAFYAGGDAVSIGAGAGKFVRRGNREQRVPVVRGIKLRGGLGVRRDGGSEIQRHARFALGLGRIHQAIAARKHRVVGLGQVGNQVTPAIVRDHFLDVARGQVRGLGNHPDAGLGSLAAGDHSADIVGADLHGCCFLLGMEPGPCGHQISGDDHGHCAGEVKRPCDSHGIPPQNGFLGIHVGD